MLYSCYNVEIRIIVGRNQNIWRTTWHSKKVWSTKTGGIRSHKSREDNTMIKRKETPNTTQKTKDWATWTPLTIGDGNVNSGRANSSYSTWHVTLVAKPGIRHEWEKDRIVITTRGTFPWTVMTRIFRNG